MLRRIYVLVIFCICNIISFTNLYEINIPGHFKWMYNTFANKDLFCPNCCMLDFSPSCIHTVFAVGPTTLCCTRMARPFWTFSQNNFMTGSLEIEYKATKLAIVEETDRQSASFYTLRYQQGNLASLPENICQFPNIVIIDFSKNKLKDLTNLCCLKLLDTLNLSKNIFQRIHHSWFSCLSYLQRLDFSHNLIDYIEPGVFQYRPRSLAYINLAGNQLISIDISNLVLGYYFGEVNFSRNNLSTITNSLDWKGFDRKDNVGGGTVNLNDNNLSRIPTFSEIGFISIDTILKGVFNYNLLLENNPFICDCLSFPYISLSIPAVQNFAGLMAKCCSPPSLRGYTVRTFSENRALLDLLICNVPLQEKCPMRCTCFKLPSRNRVVVNCSFSDLHKMSKVVPDLDNLDLDYSYNRIKHFQNFGYLNRTIRINLSHNIIFEIDPLIYNLKNIDLINLQHNQIQNLDKSIQLRNPCKTWLRNVTLKLCKCEMRGIKIWKEREIVQKCDKNENIITCLKDNKQVDISILSDTDLCPTDSTSFPAVAWMMIFISFFILGIVVISYNFRYEITLLSRILRVSLFRDHHKRPEEHDVYLSFNVENYEIRSWTIGVLNSFLQNQGYAVCFPSKHFDVGGIHVDQIRTHVARSKSFIIVLSLDYQESPMQTLEFNHIWNTLKSDHARRIIIINYDIIDNKDLYSRKLKALLRIEHNVNFSNFNKCLLSDVKNKLGAPTEGDFIGNIG